MQHMPPRHQNMMLGSKGLLPPTDANEKFRFELLRSKLLPQFCKHSESVDLLRKSLLPHVWRVPSSKALSCKHERLFDLLTLASWYIPNAHKKSRWRHIPSPAVSVFVFKCLCPLTGRKKATQLSQFSALLLPEALIDRFTSDVPFAPITYVHTVRIDL